MPDIAYTEWQVVHPGERPVSLQAQVDIAAGQAIRPDESTGRWVLALADTAANAGDTGVNLFVAARDVKAGTNLTGYRDGAIFYADGLDGVNFGDPIYLSNTPGAWADAAGTVPLVVFNVTLFMLDEDRTPTKHLRVAL